MTAQIATQHEDRIGPIVAHTMARLHAATARTLQRVGVAAIARRLTARAELPVLDEVHPDAGAGTRIDRGIHDIAVDDIRGTAVGGPKLRGADFKPVDAVRSAGWRIRWQRLERAYERPVILPPIEVFEVGGEYWVVDGHNRVAMARQKGVAFLDANVTGIRWPGSPALRSNVTSLGAVLEAGVQQRAAASGRWMGASSSSLAALTGWRPTPLSGCTSCA